MRFEPVPAGADGNFQRLFGESKRSGLTRTCRDCTWLRFCNGGCPKDRFGKSPDGEEGQYILCEGLKAFFAHAEPILRHVMDLSAGGMKPDGIMRAIADEASKKQ